MKKNLTIKVSGKLTFILVLLCVFLFSGFAFAEAASSANQNILKFRASPGNSLEGKNTFLKSIKPVLFEKSRSRTTTSLKINFSREKNLKKAEKKGARSCSLAPAAAEGCFTNCLSRYVSPDLVAQCADACGRGDLSGCGSCLGLGAFIVAYCALECSGAEVPEDPPVSNNTRPKTPINAKWKRQNTQTVSR